TEGPSMLTHPQIQMDLRTPGRGPGAGEWVTVPIRDARAALAAGADGLLVEVHATPDAAWSDASQALPLSSFRELMPQLARVLEALGRTLDSPQDLPRASAPAGSPNHG
ncbi:MAG: hypothetical protein ACPGQD_06670, partial [Planctomycetota bacterium]